MIDTQNAIFEVTNPVTGEVIGRVPKASSGEVEMVVDRAREAQKRWGTWHIEERCRVLREFGDLMWRHQQEAMDVIRRETGKSWTDAYGEITGVDVTTTYYVNTAPSVLRPESRPALIPPVHRGRVYHKPIGVAGLITPWNYPMMIPAWELIPALLAGNTVVIKPSEVTPYSAFYLVDMLYRAGLPDYVAQVVTGDGETGAALVDTVDYIAFTGSTAVGRKIAARAGERLIPSSLELGGKDPMIVLKDADLDLAAAGMLNGAFPNAGQACVGTERVYVEEDIYDVFLQRVRYHYEALKLGSDDKAHVGSLTTPRELDRTQAHIRDALSRGADLMLGGRKRTDLGPLFFEPTVLVNADHSMRVMNEETFGPVVPVMKVKNATEAIRLANTNEYGLSASIFTRDLERGERLATLLDTGDVVVNRTVITMFSPALPWGGQKNSGLGRRGGSEGLLRFTASQSVVVDTMLGSVPFPTHLTPMTHLGLLAMRYLRRYLG